MLTNHLDYDATLERCDVLSLLERDGTPVTVSGRGNELFVAIRQETRSEVRRLTFDLDRF